MAPGPKPIPLVLSEAEHEALVALLPRRSKSQDVALRARIVLACADPQATNTALARRLGVSRQSAGTGRAGFNAHRWDGLSETRPGAAHRAKSGTTRSNA